MVDDTVGRGKLHQFVDDLSVIHGRDWTSRKVKKLDVWIHTEDIVDSGMDIGGRDRPFCRPQPAAVGCADDLAALDASAAENAGHRITPVVSARCAPTSTVVHLGGSAEFAAYHH